MTTAAERKMTKLWIEKRSDWTLVIMAEFTSGATISDEVQRVVARNNLPPEQHVAMANHLAEQIALCNDIAPPPAYMSTAECLTSS